MPDSYLDGFVKVRGLIGGSGVLTPRRMFLSVFLESKHKIAQNTLNTNLILLTSKYPWPKLLKYPISDPGTREQLASQWLKTTSKQQTNDYKHTHTHSHYYYITSL